MKSSAQWKYEYNSLYFVDPCFIIPKKGYATLSPYETTLPDIVESPRRRNNNHQKKRSKRAQRKREQ